MNKTPPGDQEWVHTPPLTDKPLAMQIILVTLRTRDRGSLLI